MSNIPSLARLLHDPAATGIFAVTKADTDNILRAAAGSGFNVWQLDLSSAGNSAALLAIFGRSLHFPDWYGENWDALADCLSDLSWCEAPGHVLLVRGTENFLARDPHAFAKLLDILHDVCMIWREGGVAFWVLIDAKIDDIPALPARPHR
ncbi:MAG: hypothetical protein JWL63_357 [Rhodocyclales bacterium]|nr:hypothetical protein [Rhodocyclales bacterium]